MFYCRITNKLSQPGEKCNKLVVATRQKTYTRWVREEDSTVWNEVEVGHGFEPVKEINVSTEGLALWESWSEADRLLFVKTL